MLVVLDKEKIEVVVSEFEIVVKGEDKVEIEVKIEVLIKVFELLM